MNKPANVSGKANLITTDRTVPENVPVNKGHFALDTPEREKRFHDNLGSDWPEGYKQYRKDWSDLPERGIVRDYPILVDLEMSSLCNLTCPMCYTITDKFVSKITKGLMDFDLFTKVIDEIAGKVDAVRLSLRGEPTMNKHYRKAIKYAKDKGIKEVSSLTNGSALKGRYMRECVDNGIDWITISIDGLAEQYDHIRKPLTFEKMTRYLEEIQEYKAKQGLKKPVVKVQGIWPAIRPNPTEYYNRLKEVADLVAYNPLIDYLFNDSEIVYEDKFRCPQPYQRLTIHSDGKAAMCANAGYGDDEDDKNEIVGDVNTQSVYDIWHGSKMQAVREQLNKPDGFMAYKNCRGCYYPRKAEPNERAMVGDREIWVENYLNREQEVGS